MTLSRRIFAEALGSAFLLLAVVGSGIMAERLAAGNIALALLANALATGGALIALIVTFGPISGAHFNPAVSMALAWRGLFAWRDLPGYLAAQFLGAWMGVIGAHYIFALPLFELSAKIRAGAPQQVSEFIATFGLLAVIFSCVKHRAEAVPYAVAAYIVGAYWFTASTSFANPAVTLARAFTDSFAGILLADVPAFIVAQVAATIAATLLFSWLLDTKKNLMLWVRSWLS